MTHVRAFVFASTIAGALGIVPTAFGQSGELLVEIVVPAGRPLRVVLDQTVTVKRVGQLISGTLVDDVYAYDRIVLSSGARVVGHIDQLEPASKAHRVRAMLAGDFSPTPHVVLRFDTVVASDGRSIPLCTVVTSGAEHVTRQVAGGDASSNKPGVGADAQGDRTQGAVEETVSGIKDRARDALSAIKEPNKMERLKEAVLSRLPYHPQFLRKGTVYTAQLQAPLSFGTVVPVKRAPAGTSPAPDSLLSARLVTALDSAKTPRGTAMDAVLTEPIFSAAHELILPEGTRLEGEVTFAKAAQRWHRNGQLRFLLERAQLPAQDPSPLLGSLYAVDVSQDDHVTLDDEGGARVTNAKTRFVAPALAVLALRGSVDQHHHDGDANDVGTAATAPSGHVGSRGLGGFFGFGLLGVGLSQLSRPAAVAFAVVGAARTTYRNIIGKGRELAFPAGTPIQIRLAPAKTPDR
jgi:hypothetical protein